MGTFRDLLRLATVDPRALLRAVKRAPLVRRGLLFSPPAIGAQTSAPQNGNPLRRYFENHNDGNGIWKFDHYFDVYHRHLAKFVGTDATLLEIGVFSGGSLDMWRDYLGPRARIWGIDIEPGCRAYHGGQIEIFIGSQGDRKFLASINPVDGIDAVVDDGSHLPEHQIVSFEELFGRLKPGGVYICEDVGGSHNMFLDYVHGLTKNLSAILPTESDLEAPANPLQGVVESIHVYPFAVVVEKRASRWSMITSQKKGSAWQPFSAKAKT